MAAGRDRSVCHSSVALAVAVDGGTAFAQNQPTYALHIQ